MCPNTATYKEKGGSRDGSPRSPSGPFWPGTVHSLSLPWVAQASLAFGLAVCWLVERDGKMVC